MGMVPAQKTAPNAGGGIAAATNLTEPSFLPGIDLGTVPGSKESNAGQRCWFLPIAHHPGRLAGPVEIRPHVGASLAAGLADESSQYRTAEDHPASGRH